MGNTSSGTSSQTSGSTIAPQLQPLFGNTASMIQNLQGGMPDFSQFFQSNPQAIPGFTPGQQALGNVYQNRAFGGEQLNAYDTAGTNYAQLAGQLNPLEAAGTPYAQLAGQINAPEQLAREQIARFTSGDIGQSPVTQAAMAAVRNPALNDLAMAGLGNSDAVKTSLTDAYAPILAQEMATRAGVIPQLAALGQQQRAGQEFGANYFGQQGQQLRSGQEFGANFLGQQGQMLDTRQGQRLGEYGTSEEAARQIQAQQGQADLADFLRRQGLGTQFTTGILSGFPSISGSTVVGKTSGDKSGTVLCTELRKQGLMDWETYRADVLYGESLPPEVIHGYHRWGKPVASLMRRSPRLTRFLAPVILLWAKQIKGERSFAGRLMLKLGVPLCGALGRI